MLDVVLIIIIFGLCAILFPFDQTEMTQSEFSGGLRTIFFSDAFNLLHYQISLSSDSDS